jgi:hypothetical protein
MDMLLILSVKTVPAATASLRQSLEHDVVCQYCPVLWNPTMAMTAAGIGFQEHVS